MVDGKERDNWKIYEIREINNLIFEDEKGKDRKRNCEHSTLKSKKIHLSTWTPTYLVTKQWDSEA